MVSPILYSHEAAILKLRDDGTVAALRLLNDGINPKEALDFDAVHAQKVQVEQSSRLSIVHNSRIKEVVLHGIAIYIDFVRFCGRFDICRASCIK
jgi:hypothetical protein